MMRTACVRLNQMLMVVPVKDWSPLILPNDIARFIKSLSSRISLVDLIAHFSNVGKQFVKRKINPHLSSFTYHKPVKMPPKKPEKEKNQHIQVGVRCR